MAKKPRALRLLLEQLIDWGCRAERVALTTSAASIRSGSIEELALSRAVEVVGEICANMMRDYPEWSKSRRDQGLTEAYQMRNRLAHGYDAVDPVLLFGTAADDVPQLVELARRWLDELGEP